MHILQLHADRDVKYCRQAAEVSYIYVYSRLLLIYLKIVPIVEEHGPLTSILHRTLS